MPTLPPLLPTLSRQSRHAWTPPSLAFSLLMLALNSACLPAESVIIDQDGDLSPDQRYGGDDCDDTQPAIHPGAAETCDGIDNNCNDEIDEGFSDTDKDGTLDCQSLEVCDGKDNDGDARVDEGFPDVDGDNIADCIDRETCDGLDNNANGQIDEGFDDDKSGGPDCQDNDGDGYSEDEGDCDDASLISSPTILYDRQDDEDNNCTRGTDEDTALNQTSMSYVGLVANDEAGFAVHPAGDLDGDGFPDLLVSARNADGPAAVDCGAVYFFRGGFLPDGDVRLDAADAVWYGSEASEHAGASLAALGDFNGDGYDDVAIGASDADYGGYSGTGRVYLVMGRPGAFPSGGSLLDLAAGMIPGRKAFDGLGISVVGTGDMTGDGYPDLAIAAPDVDVRTDAGTFSGYGEVYLFAGGRNGLTGVISPDDARAIFRGYRSSAGLGLGLAGGTDFSGDGLADLVISEPTSSDGGKVYLIAGDEDLRGVYTLDGSDIKVPFATISALSTSDDLGRAILAPGDMNGDGRGDLVLSSPVTAGGVGQLYLFFNLRTLVPGAISVASASVTLSQTGNGELGQGLGAAGDVNGDGLADFVTVSPTRPQLNVAYYLVMGRERFDGSAVSINSAADAVFDGNYQVVPYYLFRSSLAGMDLNQDGFSDLLLGLPQSAALDDAGQVYVYPGY